MKQLRCDIQCLRGIAIVSVLLYHLYPSIFKNGYLGVDIFFVISGYLMARYLTKSKIERYTDVLEFYYKRFKRILPTYYLVIFVAVVASHHFFFEFWWEANYRYSLLSLFCVTNQLIIHDSGDYFLEFLADGTSLNAFIHLWSLGVEMQFYLLVPFIFYGLQFLKFDVLKLAASIIITAISLCAFISIDPQFAFNFMFLRLWQFSAGFIALFLAKVNFFGSIESKMNAEKVRRSIREDITCVALSVFLICFFPTPINALFLRPLITFVTVYVIYAEDTVNQVLSSTTLSYIGDLSYTIYLVHWPVITMCGGTTFRAHFVCLVLTVLLSISIYHLFEKWYLNQSMKVISILVFSLLLANFALQYSIRNNSFWKPKYPEDLAEIIEQNRAFLPFHWKTHPRAVPCEETAFESINNAKYDFGYCKYPKGNGTLKVLVIGNSYTLNFGEEIRTTFANNNYSTFETMPIGEGYGIYADTGFSKFALDIFRAHIEKTKPDILFIFSRYSKSVKQPFGNALVDPFIKQMNENIQFYEKFVKQIFIMGPHPLYIHNFANYFMQYLTRKPDELDDLHISKKEGDKEMLYIRKRFKNIKCNKCEIFDLGRMFENDDSYLNFDPEKRLSYLDNTAHLTAAGLEVVRPVLENITQHILETF